MKLATGRGPISSASADATEPARGSASRASALYEGEVRHERLAPHRHSFRYRVFLCYLDLDELPTLFDRRWFWSARRPNLCWFRRRDYLGPTELPLREAVLARVEAELGRRPAGPIRLLTHLRTLGFVSNPVSFYFCHDLDGRLDALVAEITNTPWGERFTYVLDARHGERESLRWQFDKRFHVSPFHSMEQRYEWVFRGPGETAEVDMWNHEDGRVVFHAGLRLRRVPLDGRNLARMLVRHPWMTLRVHLAIYWQAAKLFWKRTPFHTHPEKRVSEAPAKVR